VQVLKRGLRRGLIASALAATALFLVIPSAYDAYGEGADLVKKAARSSQEFSEHCRNPVRLIIIPWQLSLEDSESRGELELSYWAICASGTSRINAKLTHSGGEWKIQKLESVRAGLRTNLKAP
jgi:hypothetical protein